MQGLHATRWFITSVVGHKCSAPSRWASHVSAACALRVCQPFDQAHAVWEASPARTSTRTSLPVTLRFAHLANESPKCACCRRATRAREQWQRVGSPGRDCRAFQSLLASFFCLAHDMLQEAGNAPSDENGAHPCITRQRIVLSMQTGASASEKRFGVSCSAPVVRKTLPALSTAKL